MRTLRTVITKDGRQIEKGGWMVKSAEDWDMYRKIGLAIRSAREIRSLSLMEAVKPLKMSFQNLQKIEAGENSSKMHTILAITDALQIDPGRILPNWSKGEYNDMPLTSVRGRNLNIFLAKKLRAERHKRKWRLKDVAERIGHARSQDIQKLEIGSRNFYPHNLVSLSRAYGVPMDYFLREEPKNPQERITP
jgi:transcriptional regulator with XRE-family HTH domain